MNEIQSYIGNYTSSTDLRTKALQILNGLDITEASRNDYRSRISCFLDYVQEQKFNNNTFLEFKRYLASRNDVAVSTKAKYLTVARVFLKELHKQGIIPIDVTLNVKSFKQGKKHKRFGLNEDEIHKLLEYLNSIDDTPENTRLKALFSLLIFQGLRQIEIVRLDVSDIDLARQTALIQGKGRDDKELINLHPRTVEALKTYMNICEIRSGALFVSRSNNNRNGRITTKSLRELVTSFLKKLDIQNSTHGFRHFFTTRLIEYFSNDLLTVQKFTRHRSVETLQVYNDNISHRENLPKYYQAFNK
jgi:site-specific recombinase XerD